MGVVPLGPGTLGTGQILVPSTLAFVVWVVESAGPCNTSPAGDWMIGIGSSGADVKLERWRVGAGNSATDTELELSTKDVTVDTGDPLPSSSSSSESRQITSTSLLVTRAGASSMEGLETP